MRWLVVAAALALVLSGCASTKDGIASSSASGSSVSKAAASSGAAASSSKAATSGTAAVAANSTNHAPVVNSFTGKVTGLNATFSLNATDADKDPLTFTLSFGDGSVNKTGSLPSGNLTYAFAKAGNYTAKLVVSDGKLTANKTVLMVVTAPAAAAAAGALDPNCQRPTAVSIPGGYYSDDRGSPGAGFVTGGGNWVYKETNGIKGLQITQNPGTAPAPLGGSSDVDTLAVKFNCQNGDELVF